MSVHKGSNGILINERILCVRAAVICFFAVGIIGWTNGLNAAVCCKRAAAAMVGGYIAGMVGAKFLNFIMSLTSTEQRKE